MAPSNQGITRRPSSARWTGLFGAGMALIFVGERLVGAGKARTALTALGLAALVVAIVQRGLRARAADGEARRIEVLILALMGLGLLALKLYFVQSDVPVALHVFDKLLSVSSPKLAVGLQVIWPALWLMSALPLVLVEIAYASMIYAPRLEVDRARDAMLSGFGVAAAVVFAFASVFVATERDKKVDLSYFRTTRPGEATRKIVGTLTEPVQISYFFPPTNEVAEEVASYLGDLKKESDKLQIARYDQALDPAKAKEMGVSGNGIVVVSRGARREQLSLGQEMESAKNQLKTLDKEIQKRLLAITRPGRTVYLTTGHGERTSDPANDTDKRSTIRGLRTLLTDHSYTLRDLGAAEGLATEVPADASVVVMLGPQKPLLPEESAALVRYFERGGHLFIALDPEAGLDYAELLGPLGLQLRKNDAGAPVQLADETNYGKVKFNDSDHANLLTNSYSSHPSVTTLTRSRAPVVILGGGALEEAKNKPKGVSVDFTIHSLVSTFADLDGNFRFDPPKEVKKTCEMAAAVTRKREAAPGSKTPAEDGKAVVIADSDLLSDAVLAYAGNHRVLVDGLTWMLGDEAIAGETATEQDVPIVHTKGQDVIWFYSSIVVAPGLALVCGWLVNRRRKKSGRAVADAGTQKEAA